MQCCLITRVTGCKRGMWTFRGGRGTKRGNRDKGEEDGFYYSMTLKRMEKLETGKVCETPSVGKFGHEGTPCPRLICAMIEYIRRGGK